MQCKPILGTSFFDRWFFFVTLLTTTMAPLNAWACIFKSKIIPYAIAAKGLPRAYPWSSLQVIFRTNIIPNATVAACFTIIFATDHICNYLYSMVEIWHYLGENISGITSRYISNCPKSNAFSTQVSEFEHSWLTTWISLFHHDRLTLIYPCDSSFTTN